ncbi:MAG TPA: phosphatidate cytidylyltransferase [Bacteroidales bacterium]|nr:phosphatidate cytidylyltransferase [Bacteroidales bacterium]HPS62214.1 phosphatidate cytidylyltransferase [Bacteroidales bacterium]
MNNFQARTITGLSMVFLLLAAIWFSGWVFALIFLAVAVLGMWEFYGLVESETCHPQKLFGTLAGSAIYVTAALSSLLPDNGITAFDTRYLLTLAAPVPLIFLTFLLEIYRGRPHPLTNIAVTVLGFLYIALPLALLVGFARPDALHLYGFPLILTGYFGFTWINDTAAYLYGKQFGKHKFFERISPKKTWEGTLAGVFVTFAAAAGFHLLAPALPLTDWLALALMVVVFGTHGDLAESLLKRSLNIKDSGTILPGHGGILDRFDTMFISAPFVFLYFFLQTLLQRP